MTKYTKEEQEFIEGLASEYGVSLDTAYTLASRYDSDNLHDEFIVEMNEAMEFNILEGVV